jgi:succinate dehydrogenase hydrophobic anchor subunit
MMCKALRRSATFARLGVRRDVRERLSSLLLVIVVVAGLWFVLSRLRIVVLVPMPWWGLALLILGAIVALYLALDHLINRTR